MTLPKALVDYYTTDWTGMPHALHAVNDRGGFNTVCMLGDNLVQAASALSGFEYRAERSGATGSQKWGFIAEQEGSYLVCGL